MQATLILGLLLAAGAVGAPGHQVPTAASASPDDSSAQALEFGPPLLVDGVPISEYDIKRLLIYGKGRPSVEWRRVSAIIDDEVARRVAEGVDPKLYEVSDEEFLSVHNHRVGDFSEKFPTLSLETEMERSYSSRVWYEREIRMEVRFDKVFIPDDPDEWPEVTYEALRAEAGDILIDDFRQSYERRSNFWANNLAAWEAKVAAGEDAGPEPEMPHEDSMYRGILRQIVRDALFETVETRTALDGLPPHLVATMDFDSDGEPEYTWTTDEIWADVKTIISAKDIADTKRFLAKIVATRHRMEREGFLIAPEEAEAALAEAAESFIGSSFNLHGIVVGSHQFPSLEAYAQYLRLFESWKRHLEPQLEKPAEGGVPPQLSGHLDRANRIMGLGQVQAEVMLVSAFDYPSNRWIENGWEKARERVDWIKSEYEANARRYAEQRQAGAEDQKTGAIALPPGDFWSLLLDEHSDYWDPPPPATGPPGSSHGLKMKGRFGDRYRNDLESMVGESPYQHFLYGHSVTDRAFFDQEIGEILGPFEGPVGYYLTRVVKRIPPTRPLNLHNEKHYELLRDDYMRYSLIGYAEESLQQAKVLGL
jgi:hypothetical protein